MKIAFCGDCVIRHPKKHKIGPDLKRILDKCDIRCLNFEVPVDTDLSAPIHKSGPVHSQSAETPAWLEENGFNLITLSNNHSLDYGENGLKETIKSFKKSTLTGIGTYETAYDFSKIRISDTVIGFLGLTHKEFGCVDCHSGTKLGTAMLTSPKVFTSIAKAKGLVDKLYLIVHAGVEYTDAPLPEWRELYKTFIDVGVDGVIASHPHVPQGWELYSNKPIVYSLGNFAFEVPSDKKVHSKWYDSYAAIIDTEDDSIKIYPLKYSADSSVVEINDTEERRKDIGYLNSLLENQQLYNEYLRAMYADFKGTYEIMQQNGGARPLNWISRLKNLIKPLLGKKTFKADKVHLLNLYQCESHRWMMMRYLESSDMSK